MRDLISTIPLHSHIHQSEGSHLDSPREPGSAPHTWKFARQGQQRATNISRVGGQIQRSLQAGQRPQLVPQKLLPFQVYQLPQSLRTNPQPNDNFKIRVRQGRVWMLSRVNTGSGWGPNSYFPTLSQISMSGTGSDFVSSYCDNYLTDPASIFPPGPLPPNVTPTDIIFDPATPGGTLFLWLELDDGGRTGSIECKLVSGTSVNQFNVLDSSYQLALAKVTWPALSAQGTSVASYVNPSNSLPAIEQFLLNDFTWPSFDPTFATVRYQGVYSDNNVYYKGDVVTDFTPLHGAQPGYYIRVNAGSIYGGTAGQPPGQSILGDYPWQFWGHLT